MKRLYLLLLILLTSLSSLHSQEERSGAILQATINATLPTQRNNAFSDSFGKIQPGSQMKLTATVKNSGTEPNAPGSLYIRFKFPEPLANQPNSKLFQTETIKVPSITPGQEIALPFSMSESWPSLFDFIRHDWGMRHYEAVYVTNDSENVIGTLSIVFSAYYYEGPIKEVPVQVPVARREDPRRATISRNAHIRPGIRGRQNHHPRPTIELHEESGNRG